jgi:hypothetical protein
MPDGTPGVSGGVLLLLGEDSVAKTVVRRLEVAQADLARIGVIDRPVTLPNDLCQVQQAASEIRAAMIVIDPLMAFLGPDANGDQKVRFALSPLARFADATNTAVVMVRHLAKRVGRNSLYRGTGSIGIIAATRSALFVGRHPEETNLRIVSHSKCNLGALARSLVFEPTDVAGTVQIEWRGECEYTADDLLTSPACANSRLADAIAFLSDILADGPVKQQVIKQSAISQGFAYRTIERAKEDLAVISDRRGWGPGSACYWRLPDPEHLEDEPDHSTPSATLAFYEAEGDTDD